MRSRTALVCRFAILGVLAAGAVFAEDPQRKIDPWVAETGARGQTEFLVMLREQADLRGARVLPTKSEKSAFVLDALAATAARAQGPLLALLESRGIEHRAYWIANMVWVRGDLRLAEELAARDDVFHVYANPAVRLRGPVASRPDAQAPGAPDAVEWGVAKVRAPGVWALGFTGQGIVVAGGDTGYDWTHVAIKTQYRGWNGSVADHNYNWHDSIHSGGGSCGADAQAPCDDFGHGTHTMGTMVGDDGGSNQIGVAPSARWIGCRNMNVGVGTPESYSECFQWFIAPTNLAGQNPDPSKAPHVINNSWGCPPDEGCTDVTILQTVVENTRAAGIEVVVSAGNAGNGCSTVQDPPAIYDASFSVGATDSSDNIAGFSSRGPVTVDGSNRLKPDISAPGVGVRSCVPGGGYEVLSGTSMAGPHVVGVVALVLSANASLIGDPDAIEPILTGSAIPRTTSETCGGVPGDQIPNNTYGWGRVDALSAFNADLAITQSDSPDPALVGVPVTYTLTVTNLGVGPSTGVVVSEGLTVTAAVNSATPSQGSCTVLTFGASCNLGTIASGASATVAIVATPGAVGTLTSNADVTSSGLDSNPGNDTSQVQTTVTTCPFPTPTITAPVSVPPQASGFAASASSGAGHTATWSLTGSGAITGGQGTAAIAFDSGDPGTTMLFGVVDSLGACESAQGSAAVSVDFLDVPPANGFHDFVNTVARNGVTAGCGSGNYCPGDPVTRAQMAVFLLKSALGSDHTPPACTGTVFDDVPCTGGIYDPWIEELAGLQVTTGCQANPPLYCPGATVNRQQMAVFLLKMKYTAAFVPPACTGVFDDVPCTPGVGFPDWIEKLYADGVTGGCQAMPLLYCPTNPNTRGQMAVFLTKTFGLQ